MSLKPSVIWMLSVCTGLMCCVSLPALAEGQSGPVLHDKIEAYGCGTSLEYPNDVLANPWPWEKSRYEYTDPLVSQRGGRFDYPNDWSKDLPQPQAGSSVACGQKPPKPPQDPPGGQWAQPVGEIACGKGKDKPPSPPLPPGQRNNEVFSSQSGVLQIACGQKPPKPPEEGQ